jgi:hypothetical protein
MDTILSSVVYKLLDEMPEKDISGWELHDLVVEATGRKVFPSTILGAVRRYADITGATFICTDRSRSKYHFIPGIRLGKNPCVDTKVRLL